MQQHGSKYFAQRSLSLPKDPWDRGQWVKIQLFQNMVMLHIKINGTTKCSNMVANFAADPQPPIATTTPGGLCQKVIIQLFQNMVILHIKLKGIMNSATWTQLFCPHTPPAPTRPWELGQYVKIHFFQNMAILHLKYCAKLRPIF